jgi:hypothetical protein
VLSQVAFGLGLVVVQIVEQPCIPPPVLVFAEVPCQRAHDALDRDQMSVGDVLLGVLAN